MTTSSARKSDPFANGRDVVLIPAFTFLMLLPAAGWIFGWMQGHGVQTPVCHWKAATGIPCFGCGLSRASVALVNGDFPTALLWQPMMTLLWAGMIPLVLLALWLPASGWEKVIGVIRQRRVWMTLLALLLANWSWLIWKGI